MLKNIEIVNFRSFSKLSLGKFSQFNLLVGSNNSGKTTFLEALFLFCGPVNLGIPFSILSFRNGGFKPNALFIAEHLKWLFHAPTKTENDLDLSMTGKFNNNNRYVALKLSSFARVKIDQPTITQPLATSFSTGIQFNDKKEMVGYPLAKLTTTFRSDKQKLISSAIELKSAGPITIKPPVMPTDINAGYIDPCAHKNPDAGIDKYSILVKEGRHDECIKLLQRIDKDIDDILLLNSEDGTPQLFVKHSKIGIAPLSSLGDGIRRIYLLLSTLVQCKNGIMLIDEIETGIHTNALGKLLNYFSEFASELNVQVFATTHSIECIDTIINSEISKDELSLFRFKKIEGQVVVDNITGRKLESIRNDLGQDVRW